MVTSESKLTNTLHISHWLIEPTSYTLQSFFSQMVASQFKTQIFFKKKFDQIKIKLPVNYNTTIPNLMYTCYTIFITR